MNNNANAVFYYLADGYQTTGKSLMGRQSAGEGFLKGFIRHSGVEHFYCYGPNEQQFQQFKRSVIQAAGAEKPCSFIPFAEYSRLGDVGCLFVPGPTISNDVWVRRSLGSREYSICGVTHTTATEVVMDSIGALLTDPVQSWDAIVCTSSVVKATVERVIHSYADYLEDRLGVRPQTPVQLPVIPLGVDCDQFLAAERETHRVSWREKLSLAEDDVAVLYMGRLSFTTKVHPLPMFLALEEAVRRTKKRVCLILAGWFDPPASEEIWKQAAQTYCPSVKAIFLDGRIENIRKEIWSAADIFTSLSDNIQETFGLTPIEAMAAGLPVVVTDWDGYRDTVRHGIDGFRLPVLMPEPGMGEDLAVRFANKVDSYGKYCGTVSQMTSVDIGACIFTFIKLIQDKELRQKMGSVGQQRVYEQYDWSRVVKKYQELWTELAARRAQDTEMALPKNGKPPMPLRLDPFTLFQEYPTGYITKDSLVTLQGGRIPGWLERISSSVMNTFAGNLLLSKDEQAVVIEHLLKHGETRVANITELFPGKSNEVVIRTIGWLGKTGVVGIRGSKRNRVAHLCYKGC